MSLLTPKIHQRLLRAAARSERKYADQMHKKQVPVAVWILKELKLPVSPKAEARFKEVQSQPQPTGTSHTVAAIVPLKDYIEALKAFKPQKPKAEVASK